MVRKQIDSSVLQEIIQWEEEFWVFYQKEVEEISQLFQQDIKSEGLEVVAERFWNNAYDRKYRGKHERIEYLPGYTYYCRYSIQKDGKLYWLKGAAGVWTAVPSPETVKESAYSIMEGIG